MRKQTLLAEIALLLLIASGCFGPYKPMEPLPGILTPAPKAMKLRPTVTDYDAMVYSEGLKAVLAGRVSNLERGDLAIALTGSALSSGSGIAAATGATGGAIAALVSVASVISSLTAVVNPTIRANALSEGNIMVLQAESRYLLCITGSGVTRVSKLQLTPCGAQLVADANSAVAATNRLLQGLMATRTDAQRVQGPSSAPTVPKAAADAINKESDAVATKP